MANKQRRQLFPEKLWDLVNKPASGIKWSFDGKRIEVDRGQLEKFLQSKTCDRSFQCPSVPTVPTSTTSSSSTSSSSSSSSSLISSQSSNSSSSSSSSAIHQTKFRSHNFDSFIRQLHFYGFKKAGNSYYHDKFQRGQPETLHSMKRKYSNLTFSGHHMDCDSKLGAKINKDTITSSATDVTHSRASSSTSYAPVPVPRAPTAPARSVAAISAATKISSKPSQPPMAHIHTEVATIATAYRKPKMADDNSNKKITVYTMRPTNSVEDFSFDNIREDKVEAVCDERTIQFRLPSQISESTGKSVWPKTLVLDSFKDGNQSILSAYFIYRLN